VPPRDNRGWLFVAPAFAVLAFVGAIPLAINTWHSFFDIFTLDDKFWVGGEWYGAVLGSARFYESAGRSLGFSACVIAVQFPLGVFIALSLPCAGILRSLGWCCRPCRLSCRGT
jgi:glycerol transport system permease protein